MRSWARSSYLMGEDPVLYRTFVLWSPSEVGALESYGVHKTPQTPSRGLGSTAKHSLVEPMVHWSRDRDSELTASPSSPTNRPKTTSTPASTIDVWGSLTISHGLDAAGEIVAFSVVFFRTAWNLTEKATLPPTASNPWLMVLSLEGGISRGTPPRFPRAINTVIE